MRFLKSFSPFFLSTLRIASGLMFLFHGTSKFFGLPQTSQTGTELMSVSGAVGAVELVAGGLLTAGLLTRPAALIAALTMAVVYVMFRLPGSVYPMLNGGELTLMFVFVFLYLSAEGPGPLSIDRMMGRG
ncbi:putative oxidoreductase [Roseibium hamelinense]|uniref:Putative oxidoreductase n=1 Tax=Roseibium hamelinense TaxID=150831 RepID=A0A562TAD3_9HYPH|nr:DoxX family protein [Roseibium hamelinense]MTI45559.1 DoxX family protein [Roseibium hamelinense]TWI90064.1 putative oxidoreductase [Roseibium hamelinense]